MVLHIIVLSAICDIRKKRNNYHTASSEHVKDLLKWQVFKSLNWFISTRCCISGFLQCVSKGNPVTGLLIFDKAMSLIKWKYVASAHSQRAVTKKSPVRTKLLFDNPAPFLSCECQIKRILLYIYFSFADLVLVEASKQISFWNVLCLWHLCSVLQFVSRAECRKENSWSTVGGAEANNRTVLQARVLACGPPHTQLWGWGTVL